MLLVVGALTNDGRLDVLIGMLRWKSKIASSPAADIWRAMQATLSRSEDVASSRRTCTRASFVILKVRTKEKFKSLFAQKWQNIFHCY